MFSPFIAVVSPNATTRLISEAGSKPEGVAASETDDRAAKMARDRNTMVFFSI